MGSSYPTKGVHVESRTENALVTMEYTIETRIDDKGDSMHPPEWKTTIRVLDIDIDGERAAPVELEQLLIAFLKDRIK